MEARLLRLRDTAAEESRCTTASRRAAEIRAARDAKRADHARCKKELVEAVMDAVGQAASHRELVQTRLSELKQTFGARLHQLLVGDAETVSAVTAPSTGTKVVAGTAPAPMSFSKAGPEEGAHAAAHALRLGSSGVEAALFVDEERGAGGLAVAGEGVGGEEQDRSLEGLRLQGGDDEEEEEELAVDMETVLTRLSTMGGRPSMRPVTLEHIMLDLE